MIAVNWLVLVLALLIPVAFWAGRKVERELLTIMTEREIHRRLHGKKGMF